MSGLKNINGQEWYNTLKGFGWFNGSEKYKGESVATSLGARNSYLVNGVYEEFKTVYCYFYNGLFPICEDGFGTNRIFSFYKLLRIYKDLEEKFQQLRTHLYTTDTEFRSRQSVIVVYCPYGCKATNLILVYVIMFMILTKQNKENKWN